MHLGMPMDQQTVLPPLFDLVHMLGRRHGQYTQRRSEHDTDPRPRPHVGILREDGRGDKGGGRKRL
jgi:hypothetical protein